MSYRMVNIPSRASLLQRALLMLPTLTTSVPQSSSISTNGPTKATTSDMMRKKAKKSHDIDDVSNYSVSRFVWSNAIRYIIAYYREDHSS
jgi:hypothetical protein